MTAFDRVERAGSQGTLVWELRSVNHRYLEPHLRLAEALRDLEGAVREGLRQGLSRGKVECTLRLNEDSTGKPLKVDRGRRCRRGRRPDQATGTAEPAGSAVVAGRAGRRRQRPPGP